MDKTSRVDILRDQPQEQYAFLSAMKNLISVHDQLAGCNETKKQAMTYFKSAELRSTSTKVINFAEKQIDLNRQVDMQKASHFAASAHYMGSKRSLVGFIIEAVSHFVPKKNGIVVDLMCGFWCALWSFL